MAVPQILKELETYTGRFPMKAMRAAIEQREAITPELLKVLETCAVPTTRSVVDNYSPGTAKVRQVDQ